MKRNRKCGLIAMILGIGFILSFGIAYFKISDLAYDYHAQHNLH